MSRRAAVAAVVAAALAGGAGLAACGGGSGGGPAAATKTVTVERVVTQGGSASVSRAGFDPASIYRREAAGVVTVLSVFPGSGLGDLLGGGGGNQEGIGSGFVISGKGEIATNAHVVTNGQGANIRRAKQVFVQFADGNQVPAKIVGTDPSLDVALLRVDPDGLTLKPLPLGSSANLVVGSPVAAIGSPFDEPQSLSVGVISGLNRTIDSLDGKFQIPGAIQTDAAINHGNSGGPLVDAHGRVLGINSQIQSTGGGGEGVGFAVPIDAVKRSLDQLRRTGRARYAYLGVTSVPVYPQLAEHFNLPVKHGAWIQQVSAGAPADKAGLKGGSGTEIFQTQPYRRGGDVIVSVDGQALRHQDDLSELIAAHAPGDTVTLTVYSGGKRRDVKVRLAARPMS